MNDHEEGIRDKKSIYRSILISDVLVGANMGLAAFNLISSFKSPWSAESFICLALVAVNAFCAYSIINGRKKDIEILVLIETAGVLSDIKERAITAARKEDPLDT